MSGLRVLIVGASVAGPAAAYWLAKIGADITIIERFPKLRPGGQAIDIRSAGVSVMRKMPGMETLVRGKSTQEEGVCFVREDGSPYGIIRATGNPDQQSLISEYEIFRGDLSKILYDFTKDSANIKYIFGEQIASMQQNETEGHFITVEFANGTPTQTFDLVVACDGATSRTRAVGLNCNVRDHVYPTNCWAAYFSTKQDLINGSKIGQGYSAIGGRCMSIGSDPAGGSRVMFMNVYPGTDEDVTLPFRRASTSGDDALKHYISERYNDIGWMKDAVMQELAESDDLYASEIVQVKVPSLHKGRFVLLGDAGYAAGPTGGGTSLALAGAYMLAGKLRIHEGDVEAGLEGYEQQMRPIIKELQKIPPFVLSIMAPQTAWGIWLRNYIFAFIAWTGLAEIIPKYLGAAFASTDTFSLPEYDWAA